jgi:uncharacterized protein YpiB (UPF0302 family)
VSLIDRFKPLCERDDGLRFELYRTCECLETIAFQHLDDAIRQSGKALEDLRAKSGLAKPLTYSEALQNPTYVKSLKQDPRIAESKGLVKTALSYLDKSLHTRDTRTLSGGREFNWYSECVNFLQSL